MLNRCVFSHRHPGHICSGVILRSRNEWRDRRLHIARIAARRIRLCRSPHRDYRLPVNYLLAKQRRHCIDLPGVPLQRWPISQARPSFLACICRYFLLGDLPSVDLVSRFRLSHINPSLTALGLVVLFSLVFLFFALSITRTRLCAISSVARAITRAWVFCRGHSIGTLFNLGAYIIHCGHNSIRTSGSSSPICSWSVSLPISIN